MIRRLLACMAMVAVCAAGIACSDNSKIIPPKTENTKLPSEASAGGGAGAAPKANQPVINPNAPSGGTAKQE